MTQFNWSSISNKVTDSANKKIKSGEASAEVDKAMMRPNSAPALAADVLIDTIVNQILTSPLSDHAIASIMNLDKSNIVSNKDGTYSIDIRFVGDFSRESLQPDIYPRGIDSLVALFNNGVDHEMHVIYGIWHGHNQASQTNIPGAHFIQNAVRLFKSGAADRYGVIKIEVDDKYK